MFSNAINRAPQKGDNFAVYPNMPPFHRPKRTSPDGIWVGLGPRARGIKKNHFLDFHNTKGPGSSLAGCVQHFWFLQGFLKILIQISTGIWESGLTLSPRLECSGVITAHCSFTLLGSSNPHQPISTPKVAGIVSMCHHAQLIFVFLIETGFFHVPQAGQELLDSSNLPALASQSAEIAGMSHHTWPLLCLYQAFGISLAGSTDLSDVGYPYSENLKSEVLQKLEVFEC
ncbi:hypothetical protein AAY473_021210 [Plecturocebus cupreus]